MSHIQWARFSHHNPINIQMSCKVLVQDYKQVCQTLPSLVVGVASYRTTLKTNHSKRKLVLRPNNQTGILDLFQFTNTMADPNNRMINHCTEFEYCSKFKSAQPNESQSILLILNLIPDSKHPIVAA